MRSWLQTVSQAATPLDLGSRLSSEFGALAASKAAPNCRMHSGLKTQSQEKQAEDKSKCCCTDALVAPNRLSSSYTAGSRITVVQRIRSMSGFKSSSELSHAFGAEDTVAREAGGRQIQVLLHRCARGSKPSLKQLHRWISDHGCPANSEHERLQKQLRIVACIRG